ncbi:hypothetical protein FSARC_2995 [Fusarium sarcochroum]|uniref:Rho-GAP domain-containing protein n=1 Tax=Fusarium sarcochroum TaxID=1208366 RepID=A0A8H4U577_9HYPO|nr:hypothetical protein FSARC_2995 [Fusarium sarcochroum]
MADPLSTAASVVGLLTAAAQISKVLANVISKARHAPEECGRIKNEVDDIRNILAPLQLFILGTRRASRSRTSLIMVEQVVATLAACVTTFSELDTFATALENDVDMGILDRLKWASKDKVIKAVLVRLESHKNSLTLMLTILTCQSQGDAESKVDKLCDLVEETLAQNSTLKERLVALGARDELVVADETIDTRLNQLTINDPNKKDDTSDATPASSDNQPRWQRNEQGFAFEEVLMSSRVYRISAKNNSDAFSIISSAGRTASWSMLSGLSLSEVSHIGIQAIPVYATDITNKEYYDFSPAGGNPQSLVEYPHLEKTSRRDRLKGLFRTSRPEQEPPQPAVFGVPMEISIEYANVSINLLGPNEERIDYGRTPFVVAKACNFLKNEGQDSDDIFAISGNPVRMSKLQKLFDSPPNYGRRLSFDEFTVHDVAGVLLRYLKSLPEPIVPYAYYANFMEKLMPFTERDLTDEEDAEVLAISTELFKEIPVVNRHVVLYVIDNIQYFSALDIVRTAE